MASVSISGDNHIEGTFSAGEVTDDKNGVAANPRYSYEWEYKSGIIENANYANIPDASGDSVTLDGSQVYYGARVRVAVSYDDANGDRRVVRSNPTNTLDFPPSTQNISGGIALRKKTIRVAENAEYAVIEAVVRTDDRVKLTLNFGTGGADASDIDRLGIEFFKAGVWTTYEGGSVRVNGVGDYATAMFRIPIIDDDTTEGTESFDFTLENVDRGKSRRGKVVIEEYNKEWPDTLASTATAKVLLALCEGPIEGVPTEDIYKSIYIDETPIKSQSGRDNFKSGVQASFRNGELNPEPLTGFGNVEIEQAVGIKVTKEIPSIITTTSNRLASVRVRVGIGGLFQTDERGNTFGASVSFTVVIRDFYGAEIVRAQEEISGKARGAVDFEYSYALSGTGPWTIRIIRNTADADDLKTTNAIYFKGITGVISQTFKYPYTTLLGMVFKAEQFNSLPRVAIRLKGKIIKIPSNYNADSRVYSPSVWDGQFKDGYTNNPVWIYYDLLTNSRYGCGDFIEASDIDIYNLYALAKYCDEMVPDGKGGTEPRFTINAYINNRGEAYEVLNALAAAFRGMVYYAEGVIRASIDKPRAVSRLFTPSNVVAEYSETGELTRPPFSYEGVARKARKTVALVSWNDPDDLFKTKVEYVEEPEAIAKYGYREVEIRAFGCTSRGQAQRLGKWTLLSDLYETETVTFKVPAEGFFMLPGEVIEVGDPSKNPSIAAGIVEAVTGSTVVIDREVALQSGVTYTLVVKGPEGEIERTVVSDPGTQVGLAVSPAINDSIRVGSPWILRPATIVPRKFRVIGLAEVDGAVAVSAVSYNESKFNAADQAARAPGTIPGSFPFNSSPVVATSSISLEVR